MEWQRAVTDALLLYSDTVAAALRQLAQAQADLEAAGVSTVEGARQASCAVAEGLRAARDLVQRLSERSRPDLEARREALAACSEEARSADRAAAEARRYAEKLEGLSAEERRGSNSEKFVAVDVFKRIKRNQKKWQSAQETANLARARAQDSLRLCEARREGLCVLARGAVAGTVEALSCIVVAAHQAPSTMTGSPASPALAPSAACADFASAGSPRGRRGAAVGNLHDAGLPTLLSPSRRRSGNGQPSHGKPMAAIWPCGTPSDAASPLMKKNSALWAFGSDSPPPPSVSAPGTERGDSAVGGSARRQRAGLRGRSPGAEEPPPAAGLPQAAPSQHGGGGTGTGAGSKAAVEASVGVPGQPALAEAQRPCDLLVELMGEPEDKPECVSDGGHGPACHLRSPLNSDSSPPNAKCAAKRLCSVSTEASYSSPPASCRSQDRGRAPPLGGSEDLLAPVWEASAVTGAAPSGQPGQVLGVPVGDSAGPTVLGAVVEAAGPAAGAGPGRWAPSPARGLGTAERRPYV